MDAGFPVGRVNTSKVRQYEGLKHTDDRHDSFWLAQLMRLGILPAGYVYPKKERAVRDLLRERRRLVRQRITNDDPPKLTRGAGNHRPHRFMQLSPKSFR